MVWDQKILDAAGVKLDANHIENDATFYGPAKDHFTDPLFVGLAIGNREMRKRKDESLALGKIDN